MYLSSHISLNQFSFRELVYYFRIFKVFKEIYFCFLILLNYFSCEYAILSIHNSAASSWKSCLKEVLIIYLEHIPLLQSLPIHPSGHSHLYPPIKLMHLPPCKQGERVRHSLISVTVTFQSESFQSKDNHIS